MWVTADSIAIVHNGIMDDILDLLKYGIIIFALQMGKQALWGQVTCSGESHWRLAPVNHQAHCHRVHKGRSITPKGQGRADMISIPGRVQHGIPNTDDHKDPPGSRRHPPAAAFIHPLVEHPTDRSSARSPSFLRGAGHCREVSTTKAGAPEGKQSIQSAENPPFKS